MVGALDVEQIEALIEKNRALVARERERINELKTQNADTLQEICTSMVVPASAFGMSYARAYFGERASIAGIAIDAGVGLILKLVAGCFGLSVSKGGQRVGKFFHDVANGALASWTAALGAEHGAKKRLEMTVQQLTVGAVGLSPGTLRMPGPMTHEELAAITTATSMPNAGAVESVPPTPTPISAPMDYGHIAAIAAAMSTPPPIPQQRAPTPAQPPTPQPAPESKQPPAAAGQKPYRFTQSREAPLPDSRAAFASGGIYPIRDIDKNLPRPSKENALNNLDEILRWARLPLV